MKRGRKRPAKRCGSCHPRSWRPDPPEAVPPGSKRSACLLAAHLLPNAQGCGRDGGCSALHCTLWVRKLVLLHLAIYDQALYGLVADEYNRTGLQNPHLECWHWDPILSVPQQVDIHVFLSMTRVSAPDERQPCEPWRQIINTVR